MRDDARVVTPMRGPVALVGTQAAPLLDRVGLRGEQMDPGMGEVGDAAGVVEVAMGEDHIAHLGRVAAERTDPAHGGAGRVQVREEHMADRAQAGRGAHIVEAEAGVDQDQALLDLEQQHMAHHRPDRGAQGAAVEVVDPERHVLSRRRRCAGAVR